MAEVRRQGQGGRGPLLLLTVIAVGLSAAVPAAAEAPVCAPGSPALQETCSHKGEVALDVPSDWDCEVREFADGIVVEDRAGGCRLEFLRSPGLMSATEAARLYEALYLGENQIDPACASQLEGQFGWAEEVVVGEYLPPAWGRRVHALFAVAGEHVVVGLLRCPKADDGKVDWSVAAAIFRSYRPLEPAPIRWSAGSGVFGSLYFFLKIPINQFQNPD